MFGFPVNLQDSGVQKFTNDADNGFPKIQQREVFYSVKDGNWDDPTTWQTASGRIGKIPGQFDDVYAKHQVALNPNFTINNLFVSGRIYPIAGNRTYNINGNIVINHNASYDNNLNNGITINVFGDIKCFGSFTMNNNTHVLRLYGQNNYIEKSKFTSSVSSAVSYERVGNQDVLDLNYGTLNVFRPGTKTLQGNTIVQGSLTCQGDSDDLIFELGGYDFSVLGGTFIFRGSIKRSTSNPILFVGNVAINGNSANSRPFILDGNCNVEFRGGISIGSNVAVYILGSSGTFSFTTNNQSISGNANDLFIDNPIVIGTGVTLTMASSVRVYLNNTINGADSTSTLLMGLNGQMYFNTSVSVPSMTTGIWNFTTNANTIGYTGNYTATIPSYFTTFHNLTISGTGTKSLGVNTICNGNLIISSANLALTTYNLQVGGTTNTNGVSTFTKTGSGNLIFIGGFQINPSSANSAVVDFSGGNPSLEFRGGMGAGGGGTTFIMKLGTNTARFTTNNQNIDFSYCGASPVFDGPVLIEGINLTLVGRLAGRANYVFNNSIDGTNISSTFTNQGWLRFNNISFTNPMATNGTFIPSSGIYAWLDYAFNGNFTIPAYTTLNALSVQGTGTKTLSANLTTNEISSSGTLDLSTFNLINNGVTNGGTIKKSGAGTILFVGSVSCAFDFSGGNPNVEFRNGFSYSSSPYITGTGQFTFSTNNQVFQAIYGGVVNMDCSILISGAITLSIPAAGAGVSTFNFNKVINGDNAASKFLMNTNSPMTYNAATQPMATGILDTSTNLNTWIYGSGNQDIKGGPTTGAKQVYRNLTFNGGGTKTLQGYVSVQNTYTLTSPATLNNNGFTLTNP